jgi:6-phosphofructokinase 2
MNVARGQGVAVLALNPSVDISYEIQQLLVDRKVRADSTRYFPGGNGINVARSLAELGAPFACCSVVGGESGDLFLRLLGDSLGQNHRIFRVDGETRVNATLLQKLPRGQYEVDSAGPEIPPAVLDELTDCFLSGCGTGYGVLTGSLPPGVPDDYVGRLAQRIRDQGGRAAVDAYGPVLSAALEAQPHLVRLNRYVLEMTVKRRLESIEAVAGSARDLQRNGISCVCISLGADGAILVNDDNSLHCSAPRIHVQSTVGCGDALLAGLLTAACRGEDAGAMLRLGVLCGSATATKPGTELFRTEDLDGLASRLELTVLDI